jgi:hypothetical protein
MRSKDSQPGAHDEADDLDALASELGSSAPEIEDDEVDLDRLAAVAGGRALASANGAQAEPGASDKLDLKATPALEGSASAAPGPAATSARADKSAAVAQGEPPVAQAPAPRASNRIVSGLVVLALALGGLGYALGRSSQPQPGAASTTSAADPSVSRAASSAPAAPAMPPEVPAAAAPSTPAPAPAVSSPAAPASRAGTEPRAKPALAGTAASPARRAAPIAAQPAAEPATEPAPVVRVEPNAEKDEEAPVAAKSTVDDLLDQALASPSERRAAETTAEAVLPEAPSREEVTQTMAVLLPAIRGCAMGQTGLATAGIVVRADGRVASVELSGAPFADTASGRCMEGVIRRARFSRFRQPTFRVRFPFAIQ